MKKRLTIKFISTTTKTQNYVYPTVKDIELNTTNQTINRQQHIFYKLTSSFLVRVILSQMITQTKNVEK